LAAHESQTRRLADAEPVCLEPAGASGGRGVRRSAAIAAPAAASTDAADAANDRARARAENLVAGPRQRSSRASADVASRSADASRHAAAGAAEGDIAKRETPFETLPLPSRLREARNAERRSEPAPKPAPERGPAILKSGVIDGMPYTLYADGSIEAELPHGTVKFASVDALRAHLEKQG
jgi:hypothetical protein